MNTINASEWNRLVDELRRNQVMGSTMLQSGGWRHPWQITPSWDAEHQRWAATIEPGFVNGLDATVSIALSESPEATRLRHAELGMEEADRVDAWLTDVPLLPLTAWRAIGADADPQSASVTPQLTLTVSFEPVPEFFTTLGVGEPLNIGSQIDDLGIVTRVSGEVDAVAEKRLLRSCDLVLYQDRFATSTQWTQGLGIDGTFMQFNVIYQIPPNMRERAYLRVTRKYEPVSSAEMQDRLKGDWTDQTFDALHLATIYMVSPEGAAYGSAPDDKWTPYVKHRVFWNLNHASNVLEPALKRENIVFNTGLAMGLLDSIANQILATINDQNAAIAEFLGRNTLQGRFWST